MTDSASARAQVNHARATDFPSSLRLSTDPEINIRATLAARGLHIRIPHGFLVDVNNHAYRSFRERVGTALQILLDGARQTESAENSGQSRTRSRQSEEHRTQRSINDRLDAQVCFAYDLFRDEYSSDPIVRQLIDLCETSAREECRRANQLIWEGHLTLGANEWLTERDLITLAYFLAASATNQTMRNRAPLGFKSAIPSVFSAGRERLDYDVPLLCFFKRSRTSLAFGLPNLLDLKNPGLPAAVNKALIIHDASWISFMRRQTPRIVRFTEGLERGRLRPMGFSSTRRADEAIGDNEIDLALDAAQQYLRSYAELRNAHDAGGRMGPEVLPGEHLSFINSTPLPDLTRDAERFARILRAAQSDAAYLHELLVLCHPEFMEDPSNPFHQWPNPATTGRAFSLN